MQDLAQFATKINRITGGDLRLARIGPSLVEAYPPWVGAHDQISN
jgi:hypothetical protein